MGFDKILSIVKIIKPVFQKSKDLNYWVLKGVPVYKPNAVFVVINGKEKVNM